MLHRKMATTLHPAGARPGRAANLVRRNVRLAILAAVVCCLLGPLAYAQQAPTVLGPDGTVFRLHQGLYGDLFGEGGEADADSPVLALDVRRSDGLSERMLVPGTETDDSESSASIVFEDTTGVVFLAWETLFNGQHSLLQLTRFDGAEWSELIEITSNVFASKGAAQLVVQREADQITDGDSETWRSRTTLHLTWWEESAGISRKLHALIILEDGQYIGWTPIFDLGTYVSTANAAAPPEVPGLENALRLQAGRNHRMVVSGFVHPLTHRLITLEVEALSQVIGDFAAKIRAQIVVIGLQIGSGGLAKPGDSEIITTGQSAAGGEPHYYQLTLVSDREAPAVGGPAELMLSDSGRNVIAVWEEDGYVVYRESLSDGWSDPSSIELTEDLDRETVYRMLSERIRAD